MNLKVVCKVRCHFVRSRREGASRRYCALPGSIIIYIKQDPRLATLRIVNVDVEFNGVIGPRIQHSQLLKEFVKRNFISFCGIFGLYSIRKSLETVREMLSKHHRQLRLPNKLQNFILTVFFWWFIHYSLF